MTPDSNLLQRLQELQSNVHRMLTLGQKDPLRQQTSLLPILDRVGVRKSAQVLKQLRMLSEDRIGRITPTSFTRIGHELQEKFANPAALLHIKLPTSGIWSEIEQVLPTARDISSPGKELSDAPGTFRRGTVIQRLSTLQKPGQEEKNLDEQLRTSTSRQPTLSKSTSRKAAQFIQPRSHVEEISNKANAPSLTQPPAKLNTDVSSPLPDEDQKGTLIQHKENLSTPMPDDNLIDDLNPENETQSSQSNLPSSSPALKQDKHASFPRKDILHFQKQEPSETTSADESPSILQEQFHDLPTPGVSPKKSVLRALPAPSKQDTSTSKTLAKALSTKQELGKYSSTINRHTSISLHSVKAKDVGSSARSERHAISNAHLAQIQRQSDQPVQSNEPTQHPDKTLPAAEPELHQKNKMHRQMELASDIPLGTKSEVPTATSGGPEEPIGIHQSNRQIPSIAKPRLSETFSTSIDKILHPLLPVQRTIPGQVRSIKPQTDLPEDPLQMLTISKHDLPLGSVSRRENSPLLSHGPLDMPMAHQSSPSRKTDPAQHTTIQESPPSLPQPQAKLREPARLPTPGNVIQRLEEDASNSFPASAGELSSPALETTEVEPALDLDKIAEDVLPIVKRLMEIETERSSGYLH